MIRFSWLIVLLHLTVYAQNGFQVDALVYPLESNRIFTVGGSNADIAGFNSKAIQTAIDAVAARGGGTVKLLPGEFDITAPVFLSDYVTLCGSGSKTVLRKTDGFSTPFIVDADYGELKLTVQDPAGFEAGMGVQIYDEDQNGGWDVSTAVITKVVDNVVYIDTYLVRDYRADHNGIISNACSIIAAVCTDSVKITDLVIDGNKDNNDYINGCRAGGVYIHKSKNVIVENVHVRDFDGDGISWQITENITIRHNTVTGCTHCGLHPGSGSPLTTIQDNDVHHNEQDGLFICWRVHHGKVVGNKFHHNTRYGLCTGHKDTDMLFENNHIFENGRDGVHFRAERQSNAPHSNTFINNIIENNGTGGGGYGFSFNSPAENVLLKGNTIRDTGYGFQKAAVFMYKNGSPVELENNRVSGHKLGTIAVER
ncbi:right-handed parallel beta-helix repeat-containing protein [candidate division KSB1 bacterium]|nr:right-handed parallel beta-helix repeat-containing protein [candidate division KSB1 bacterium]